MKIVFDDAKSILGQLVNLYMSLPEELRTKNDIIPASELIFEAIEYIAFLKETMAFRTAKPMVNKALDDPWTMHGTVLRSKATQTTLNVIPKLPIPAPQVPQFPQSRGSIIQQRIISTANHGFGNHFLASKMPSNAENQQPIVVKTKDPKTGLMKSVTLYPKNIKSGNEIKTIKLGTPTMNQPPVFKVASPQAGSMTVPSKAMPALKPLKPMPGNALNKIEDDHGLICKHACQCSVMQGGPISDKDLTKLWAYLKKCLKVGPKEAENLLTFSMIQEKIFKQLLSELSRESFFEICRMVSFIQSNLYCGEKKNCVLIRKKNKPLTLNLRAGEFYTLPSILVKMFREGFESHTFSSLVLESLPDCRMSKSYAARRKYLCINPYHYGYDVNANNQYNETDNHHCVDHVKVQVSGSSVNTMCKVCGRILTDADQQELKPAPLSLKHKVPEAKKHLEEVTIEDLDNEFQGMLDSIEEQVNDELAQDTLQVEPPEMTKDTEVSEEPMDPEDMELIDNKANLHIELGLPFSLNESNEALNSEPKENEASNSEPKKNETLKSKPKKRPLEQDKTKEKETNLPVEKKIKVEKEDTEENKIEDMKPEGKDHQCDQCLEWFKDKGELEKHSCLDTLNIHGKIMYACHFCATSSNNLDSLRPHVAKCKKFNLAALRVFQKFESAMTTTTLSSVSVEASPRSRSRTKKGDNQPSKCEQCQVTFQSKSELVLHNSKPKCKSHECPKCHKFFANERTLKSHQPCEEDADGQKGMSEKPQVDQDIKVIKLDKTKMFRQPAKCRDCRNLLPTIELLKAHQSVHNFCGICIQKFPTTCKLLRHNCPGPQAPAKVQPKPRIKTEPVEPSGSATSSHATVILKTISDSSIPAILDETEFKKK